MLRRIENILIGCATLLSTGDRLTLIKSVFASMHVFFMCSLRTPKTVIKQINYYLGQCLWRKYGSTQTGSALISWEEVCKPKSHGGLGVLDIYIHNQALLKKFLHKFFNREDIPWAHIIWEAYYSSSLPWERMVGSFWWKALLKLLPIFKQFALCKPDRGDTMLFCTDKWSGQPLSHMYPELFSFSNKKTITLQQAYDLQDFSSMFHRPLSLQAYTQFNTLQDAITRNVFDLQD